MRIEYWLQKVKNPPPSIIDVVHGSPTNNFNGKGKSKKKNRKIKKKLFLFKCATNMLVLGRRKTRQVDGGISGFGLVFDSDGEHEDD